jgi:hypothetical protein
VDAAVGGHIDDAPLVASFPGRIALPGLRDAR